jgi:hypothetical protein
MMPVSSAWPLLVTGTIEVKDILNTNEYRRDGTVIKFHNSKSILDAEGLVMNHMFWIDATINKQYNNLQLEFAMKKLKAYQLIYQCSLYHGHLQHL